MSYDKEADGRDGWEEEGEDDSRKPRRMEESLVTYLSSLSKQLTTGGAEVDEESRSLLVDNVLVELKQCTASAACDRRINTIVEKICLVSSMENIIELLTRFSEYAVFLARNRHSSHVIQALLARLCSLLKFTGVSSDEQEAALVEALLRFARPVLAELSWLARELSASHVIRAVICVLVGMPVVSERKGAQSKHQHSVELSEAMDSLLEPKHFYVSKTSTFPVPESFHEMLGGALAALLTLSTAELQDMAADTSSAAVLGLAMRVLMCPDLMQGGTDLGERLARQTLNWPDTNEGVVTGAPAFYGMSADKAGSYFLEAIVECGEMKLVEACVEHSVVGRAKDYAEEPISNFVLQAVMRRLSVELERVGDEAADKLGAFGKSLLKELLSTEVFPTLVATKGGVVLWMIELAISMPKPAASKSGSKKTDWADKIGRAVIGVWNDKAKTEVVDGSNSAGDDVEEEKTAALVEALTQHLSPKDLSVEETEAAAAAARNKAKNKKKGKSKFAVVGPPSLHDSAQLLHARLVGALLKARGTFAATLVAGALARLPASLLQHICISGPLSRAIVDAFLDTAPVTLLNTFLTAIRENLVPLSVHFLGRHIVVRVFNRADAEGKHLVASTLLAEKDAMKKTKEGRWTIEACQVDLLGREPEVWHRNYKRQAQGSQILAELTTTVAGGASAAAKDDESAAPFATVEQTSNSYVPKKSSDSRGNDAQSDTRKRKHDNPIKHAHTKTYKQTHADFEKIDRLRGAKLGLNLTEEVDRMQRERKKINVNVGPIRGTLSDVGTSGNRVYPKNYFTAKHLNGAVAPGPSRSLGSHAQRATAGTMGCTASNPEMVDGGRGRGYSTVVGMAKKGLVHYKDGPLTHDQILSRIESSEESIPANTGVHELSVAYLTQRGYYPDDMAKENQDAYSCHTNFGEYKDQMFVAVYDGHGKDGHLVSRYSRDELPRELLNELSNSAKLRDGNNVLVRGVAQISRSLSGSLIAAKRRLSSSSNISNKSGDGGAEVPEEKPRVVLTEQEIKDALQQAHLKCNEKLRQRGEIGSDLSGTTSVSVYMVDGKLYCSNLGDSRAILISETEDGGMAITPLSKDQTPYRKDERDRVRKYGARIMSMDQLDGTEPMHDNWQELTLGEDLDVTGDPPRIWHPKLNVPGTAFTRSIGDFFAETLGVVADPEIYVHTIGKRDRYIVIASDGVYEFLNNRTVAHTVIESDSPLHACQVLVRDSYEKWLAEEVRTDDITAIVVKINEPSKNIPATQAAPQLSMPSPMGKKGQRAEGDGDDSVTLPPLPPSGVDPRMAAVRRGRKGSIVIRSALSDAETNKVHDVAAMAVPKSAVDLEVINVAISSNFLFQFVTAEQRKAVIDVMQPMDVKAGHFVITQGEHDSASDHFYVVHSGRYEVRQNDTVVHTYVADANSKLHPGFGELSLLYDKPRAASVVALEDGKLFCLNRQVFKQVITNSFDVRRSVMKALRGIPQLACVTLKQLQSLSGSFTSDAAEHPKGSVMQKEGAKVPNALYVIQEGCMRVSLASPSSSQLYKNKEKLTAGMSFGINSLLSTGDKTSADCTLTATESSKVLRCTKAAFEKVLGSSLAELQKGHTAQQKIRRRPSVGAPSSITKVAFTSLVASADVSRLMQGSFNGAANVSVHSFVLSEVDALQRQGGVCTLVDAARILATGSSAKCPFIPSIMSIFKASNALHVLYDKPLVCSLRQVMDEECGGAYDFALSAQYATSCAVQALEAIHAAGIAFRNLNVEGALVDMDGRVCLEDFSICKVGAVEAKTYTICGDMNYFSPEQLAHRGHDETVDFWALGVFLYEMVTGDYPFVAKNEIATYSKIAAFAADPTSHSFVFKTATGAAVPQNAQALIEKLLRGEPKERLRGQALHAHPFLVAADWGNKAVSPFAQAVQRLQSKLESQGAPDTSLFSLFEQAYEPSSESAGKKHWSVELM